MEVKDFQDVYTRPSNEKKYHRCLVCWVYGDKYDNGFVPFDTPYPHQDFCPCKEKF